MEEKYIELIHDGKSLSSVDLGLEAIPVVSDEVKMLEFQRLYLQYMKMNQNRALISLIVKTGFKDDILVNLNYLRGATKKPGLSSGEIDTIRQINAEGMDDFDYFKKLLEVGAVADANELYQLIVLHEQRHNFSSTFPKNDTDILQYLKSLTDINQSIDLTHTDKIAIFGSTYAVLKGRISDGLEYFRTRKNIENPTTLYLLSGFRRMYISELVQLDVITQEQLNRIETEYMRKNQTKLQNIRVQDLIDFLLENEAIMRDIFDKDREKHIRSLFKQIIAASHKFKANITPVGDIEKEHFKDLEMGYDDVDNLPFPELLQKFSLCEELDFFRLAAFELKLSANLVALVYSQEMNGANIGNGVMDDKKNVRRANTQDTLKALFDIDKDVERILFVSNGSFVPQQHNAVLDVAYTKFEAPVSVQVYGKNASAGDQTRIAARHFALLSPVAKYLKKDFINPELLSGKKVKELDGVSIEKAFDIGKENLAKLSFSHSCAY